MIENKRISIVSLSSKPTKYLGTVFYRDSHL